MKYLLDESELRTYYKKESCIFKKNNEAFGGLSNMASSYPIVVNGVKIRTTESLYQACRFFNKPEIQREIIEEKSPMKVKMLSKKYTSYSRDDWEEIKIQVMRWCINIKLAQNFLTFGEELHRTGTKPIVENSSKDNFWGAIPNEDESVFVGKNALGRLLMELRERLYSKRWVDLLYIEAPVIENFYLYGDSIQNIDNRLVFLQSLVNYWRLSDSKAGKKESSPFFGNIFLHNTAANNLGFDLLNSQNILFNDLR